MKVAIAYGRMVTKVDYCQKPKVTVVDQLESCRTTKAFYKWLTIAAYDYVCCITSSSAQH